jgi:hypothetical protein
MARYPYYQGRDENAVIPDKNPKSRVMSNDTGNAGADGYSVLSRASRYSGMRPAIGGEAEYPFPRMQEDC